MSTWLFDIIGKPWAQGAQGPNSYNCWGAVRHGLKMEFGLDVPIIPDNSGMVQYAVETGWRHVSGPAKHGDVVRMTNFRGQHHVGLGLYVDRKLQVLHSDGTMTDKGPVGDVRMTTLEELRADFLEIQLWRKM